MKVNGKDDIPYIMENKKKNVWNHQPVSHDMSNSIFRTIYLWVHYILNNISIESYQKVIKVAEISTKLVICSQYPMVKFQRSDG